MTADPPRLLHLPVEAPLVRRCVRCEAEPVAWPGAVSCAACIEAAKRAIAARPGQTVTPADVERERHDGGPD
ncbi:hypothetical protein [Actinocrinis sp.]|uniref:hypothetical protein n=1 Tax=Actinocrinis sp. TaxID=1920516 RepID=UPI002D70E9AD|nr:hypothetical protein [Actinocrinis sp.]HZP51761.1 hypothetical protein [Actinocrinis sp.]